MSGSLGPYDVELAVTCQKLKHHSLIDQLIPSNDLFKVKECKTSIFFYLFNVLKFSHVYVVVVKFDCSCSEVSAYMGS